MHTDKAVVQKRVVKHIDDIAYTVCVPVKTVLHVFHLKQFRVCSDFSKKVCVPVKTVLCVPVKTVLCVCSN